MGGELQGARRGDRPIRGAEGHAGARGRTPACRVQARRDPWAAGVSRLVFPLAPVRRRSARQRRERAAPAGPDSFRQMEAGGVVVQPGAAPDSARHGPEVDGRQPGSRALSFRHRGSLPAAGTRARRGGRAADVALEPPVVVAERRICGALHCGCALSNDHALERRAGHGLVRAVPARSWRRGASSRIAPPHSLPCTRSTRPA